VTDSTLRLAPSELLPEDQQTDRIVAAALVAFGDLGYSGATLPDIARAAGVSAPALLRLFPTKDDVFREVVRSTLLGSLSARDDAAVPAEEPSAADAIRAFARQYWTTMERPEITAVVRLIIGEMPRFPELAVFHATQALEGFVRTLERLIKRGIARGELDPVDSRAAARTILATLAAHALWFAHPEIYGGIIGSNRERAIDTTIETLIQALRPTTTRST